MGFKVENPAKFWEGGGGAALGTLKWFADGEDIPDNYMRCDGRSFGYIPDQERLLRALNADLSVRNAIAGQYTWGYGSTTSHLAMSRGFRVRNKYALNVYWTDTSTWLRVDQNMYNVNFNPEPVSGSQMSGQPGVRAFNIFEDDMCLILTGNSLYYFYTLPPGNLNISQPAIGVYPTAAPAGTVVTGFAKFKGKFYAVSSTSIHEITEGAWLTPNYLQPAGMVIAGSADIVSGLINGVETLAISFNDGTLWVTTDAITWTQLPNLPTAAYSLGPFSNRSRLVHDHGVWYVHTTVAAVGQESLWRSYDLQNWQGLGFTQPDNIKRRVVALDANDGLVAVGLGTGIATPGPMVLYSVDEGETWHEGLTTETANNAGYSIYGIACNGGYINTYQHNNNTNYRSFCEIASHTPNIPPYSDGAGVVTSRAYMRVK